jgi:hypothetical protein
MLFLVLRTALRPTQPPIQWVPGLKRPGSEAGYSSASAVKAIRFWGLFPFPKRDVLTKHRENFTSFIFIYFSLSFHLMWDWATIYLNFVVQGNKCSLFSLLYQIFLARHILNTKKKFSCAISKEPYKIS